MLRPVLCALALLVGVAGTASMTGLAAEATPARVSAAETRPLELPSMIGPVRPSQSASESVGAEMAAARAGRPTPTKAAPVKAPVKAAAPKAAPVKAAPKAAAVKAPVKAAAPKAAPVKVAAPKTAGLSYHEARGRSSLAALGLNPGAHGFSVAFHPGRKGVIGLAHMDKLHLDVYVRSGISENLLQHVIAHEYAHLLDAKYNNRATRQAYLATRGISAAWAPNCTCNDFGFGAGDWSEVYATWLTGSSEWRGTLSGPPNSAQLKLISTQFFRR